MRKLYLLISTFLVLILIGAGCAQTSNEGRTEQQASDQTVKVGFIGPLSGDAASYGKSIKKGVQLAVREMGHKDKVKLFFEDSKCKGKGAVDAANKLINVNNVDAIIGGVCSNGTLAAAPVADRNDVVMISAASTAKKISQAGDYIFRTIGSDKLQGKFASELMYNEEGHEEIAVLHGKGSYGLGFKKVLENQFPKLGGNVVTSQGYKRGATDVRTQLTKIKSASPDAIYIISNSPESTAAILKQARELGIEAELFGTEGLKSEEVTKNAGRAANGLTVTAVNQGTKDFAEKHKQEFDKEAGPFSAQAYDAYTAIGKAIEAGATSGKGIKDELNSLNFEGVSGKVNFDENGDVAGNYDIYTVKNGKFTKVDKSKMGDESGDKEGGQTADKKDSVEVVDKEPDKTVTLSNFEFSKTNPKYSAGTVVKFVNKEGSHTVTLDSASIDKDLEEGESVTLEFKDNGTYQVYCRPHGSPGKGMHSNINVSS